MTLAEEQAIPLAEDEHYGGDPSRSLRLPSDRVPAKRKVDFVVIGHAYVAGAPAPVLRCRVAIGSIDKTIEVHGDRHRDAQGKVLSSALLRLEVDVPDEVAERVAGRGRAPADWAPEAP